ANGRFDGTASARKCFWGSFASEAFNSGPGSAATSEAWNSVNKQQMVATGFFIQRPSRRSDRVFQQDASRVTEVSIDHDGVPARSGGSRNWLVRLRDCDGESLITPVAVPQEDRRWQRAGRECSRPRTPRTRDVPR